MDIGFTLLAMCEEVIVILKEMREKELITEEDLFRHTREKYKLLKEHVLEVQ